MAVEAGLLRGVSEAEMGELARLRAKLAKGIDRGSRGHGADSCDCPEYRRCVQKP